MARPLSGAARRWIILAVAVLAYLIGLFHRVAPGTITQDLAQAFATSATTLGLLSATYFWVYTAMQIPAGVLADTVGPKRLLVAGGLVAAAGAAAFGLAPDFTVAAVGRTLVGLGTSVSFVATLKLIAAWFDERRFATVTGTVVLLGNLASALAGAPFAWVLSVLSWRDVMLALAGLSLAGALSAAWLVEDTPRAARPAATDSWQGGLAAVVRNRASWPLFLANFGIGGSLFGFAGLWGVPYLMDVHGMSRLVAANHASVAFAAFAIGGLSWNAMSDCIGRRKPMFVSGAAGFALSWLPWLPGWTMPLAASYALFAAMGFCAAGFTVSWACAKEVNAPRFAGIATGFVNLAIFLGPAVMQPLVGAVLDLARSGPATAHTPAEWRLGLAVLAGSAAFGLACTLAVRETYARNATRQG